MQVVQRLRGIQLEGQASNRTSANLKKKLLGIWLHKFNGVALPIVQTSTARVQSEGPPKDFGRIVPQRKPQGHATPPRNAPLPPPGASTETPSGTTGARRNQIPPVMLAVLASTLWACKSCSLPPSTFASCSRVAWLPFCQLHGDRTANQVV